MRANNQPLICVLALAAASCLCAQDAAPAAAAQAPANNASSQADQSKAQPSVAAPAATAQGTSQQQPAPQQESASPPPFGEPNFSGDIEFGYRFIPNISGSFNTYRSVINLGEGPKLFGADATIVDPKGKLFDRFELHLTTIGDDPYETAQVKVEKRNVYRLSVDWRNIAYFNYLPSYANPLIGVGSMQDENAFDTRIGSTDARLEFMPGGRFVPYIAYDRNSQYGRGVTSYAVSQNSYPVATLYSDATNTFRGGMDFNFAKFHANIEEGGTTFKDDQGASDNLPNTGTLTTTFLGQRLNLSGLNELYRVRGDSKYTKASFAADPVSWATISGQFIYAEPTTNINYTQDSTGNFYYAALAQFYSTGQDVLTGSATMPHPSGSLNIEVRPWKRIRILEYWMTDRLHNAASDLLAETLLFPTTTLTPNSFATARLSENYNQQEVDLFADLTSKLTVRVGDRYVWGDATLDAPDIVRTPFEHGSLSQNVGIGGIIYRFNARTRANADYEISESSDNYFRTALRNYQRFRVRGSHDLNKSLRVAMDYYLLTNSNPDPTINLTFSSTAATASVEWLPRGGKWFTVLADYTRSSVQSSVYYIIPQTRSTATSLYHENDHNGSTMVNVKWVSFGGTFFRSSGSRPTEFYQPMARLSIPVYKHVFWNAEWRYYGFAEKFYQYEGFRSNQVMISLRLVR